MGMSCLLPIPRGERGQSILIMWKKGGSHTIEIKSFIERGGGKKEKQSSKKAKKIH